MNRKQEIAEFFPEDLKQVFLKLPEKQINEVEEIRIRVDKPITFKIKNKSHFLSLSGVLQVSTLNTYIPDRKLLYDTLEIISGYSLYAFEEEIRNGFLTVKGGHRVGVCGKYVMTDNEIVTIKHISSLNIRLCHEIKGCADSIIPQICKNGTVSNTVIVSAPSLGKTTLLRDIVRQISDGAGSLPEGRNVSLIDEREEISGAYLGVPQNDIGLRTDALLGCPKAKGMMIALRAMAPGVIAVDEIGSDEDLEAINICVNSGVKVICTVHGDSVEDLKRKPKLYDMIEKRIFECVILLNDGFRNGSKPFIYEER